MEAGRREATARGEGLALAMLEWHTAVLYNGLARYEEALVAAAQRASAQVEPALSAWALAELVEAAFAAAARPRPPPPSIASASAHAGVRHRLGARRRSAARARW